MHDAISRLRDNVASVLFGKQDVVDRVIVCLLARGHLLIEDVPGVGKTVLATALARSIDATFSRVQLTPDLLPSDILGVEVLDARTGTFTFKKGPIFANVVLADEVNRTPPRTQAALLEAMAESTVTVDGRVLALEAPFMVIATQNPFDFEGTYALPENQLDRFLMRVSIGYPSPDEESRVLRDRPANSPLHSLRPAISRADLLALQEAVDRVTIARPLLEYIVAFANATRRDPRLLHGLSPRGSLALAQAARASALFAGRDHALPEDVVENVVAVCAHRVVPKGGTIADAASSERVVTDILRSLPPIV
ncbi:MAG: AAA family ATPase [Planctomycetota bacterium]|nr:AAA family ATPase [Planctomycetota bacterium]